MSKFVGSATEGHLLHDEKAFHPPIHSLATDILWYAVCTKSRHEKVASSRLASVGIPHYLPLRSEVRIWSDRKQIIDEPLFPGYLFVRVDLRSGHKLEVLRTPGIVRFVGSNSGPVPVLDRDIESVRTAVLLGAECSSQAFLKEGERVRVVRGALAGIEGSLLRFGPKSQLVISIDIIERSVALTVSEKDVEPVALTVN